MFKSVFRTDVTVFTKWKTVNDVKSSLTGYWLKKWQWSQEWTLIQTLKVTTCMEWPTRSLQSRGTWSGSAVDGWNTHGLLCLNHNQGASSSDIVTKDLRLIPMENIKGLSLDEAIECHYLIALDKWIWITNTTFPSSYWELFIVGDLLLGPQGWDTVHVWEGHWVWEQIPLLWDATWELWRRKDNQLQECLISTNCWKKNPCTSGGCQLSPVLEDSAVRENTAGKAGASSELFMGQVDWRADGHRGRGIHNTQPPARLKARSKLM